LNLSEKYRPKDWSEVVSQKSIVSALNEILANCQKPIGMLDLDKQTDRRKPPNMLFIGQSGTGKTTIAIIFAKHYGASVEELNASDERGLEVIREKIKPRSNLVITVLFYLNEADGITKDAQAALRPIIENSKNAVFILDVNDESKIIDPIKSRCAEFRFKPLTCGEATQRLTEICKHKLREPLESSVKKI
jgi:replication factor C small subunit